MWQQYISKLCFYNFTFKALLACSLVLISGEKIAFAQSDRKIVKLERVITFSGYRWLVKSSSDTESGTVGPGNNYFSDSKKNAWIDKKGWLHLKITTRRGKRYCAEVTLDQPLGYKKYIFQVASKVDQFHPNVVGGIFTYLSGTDGAEEIDLEFSRWGNGSSLNNAQYVLQPFDSLGNIHPFRLNQKGDATTHLFDWKPGRIDFISYHGHSSSTPSDSSMMINEWQYFGHDVPVDPNGRIHINLWIFHRDRINRSERVNGELIIKRFEAL